MIVYSYGVSLNKYAIIVYVTRTVKDFTSTQAEIILFSGGTKPFSCRS